MHGFCGLNGSPDSKGLRLNGHRAYIWVKGLNGSPDSKGLRHLQVCSDRQSQTITCRIEKVTKGGRCFALKKYSASFCGIEVGSLMATEIKSWQIQNVAIYNVRQIISCTFRHYFGQLSHVPAQAND